MKKYYIISFLSLALLTFAVMPVFAGRAMERSDARHVINRTALVIIAAQKAAQSGQVYVGLGMSVAHQRYARQLLWKGLYFRAISHSIRARAIAIRVIRRNKAELIKEAEMDKIEKFYTQRMPADKELDRQIEIDAPNDEAAVDIQIEVDSE